ncbi:hypothetical protein [Acetobacter sp. LMG 32666]|uniref:hypothetical protein n=1 Tax=Acetobacter sp. LMG 32666 TaxID=2959295 RepID=UPI0030C889C9
MNDKQAIWPSIDLTKFPPDADYIENLRRKWSDDHILGTDSISTSTFLLLPFGLDLLYTGYKLAKNGWGEGNPFDEIMPADPNAWTACVTAQAYTQKVSAIGRGLVRCEVSALREIINKERDTAF